MAMDTPTLPENVQQNEMTSISPSCDKSTQTEIEASSSQKPALKNPTLFQMLTDTAKLKIFTGLHSYELLDALVECVKDLVKEDVCRKKEMSLKNRILLTFVKLKQNMSFTSLGILFNTSRQTCVNYFKNMVPKLALVLESVIIWPDQEQIRDNLPIAFKNFRNTRIVLDCAETPIERSKCLRCRILTHSNYKGRFTCKCKFDVGVAPSGLITHISPAHGGRSSDKLIVNKSGILNKLDYQDAVMVDKGYRIERECLERNLIMYRPPFVIEKKQLSRSEAIRCAEIARARVHVERVIQRIREFKFMKETVTWELVPYIDDSLKIIGGIVNLSSPVLNVDKFL